MSIFSEIERLKYLRNEYETLFKLSNTLENEINRLKYSIRYKDNSISRLVKIFSEQKQQIKRLKNV